MNIYVQKDGQKHGPFSETHIRRGIDAGEFNADDPAWTQGKASWQPLSALIGLDVTQPPPILASVAMTNIAGLRESSSAPPPIVDRIEPPPVVEGRWKRQYNCRKCGAAYRTFTLGWFKNSDLCDECTRKRNKAWDPYDQTPIESREDALRAIRNAGIFYLVLVGINIVLGLIDDPVFLGMALILLVCDLFMWLKHSRVAVVLLIILMIGATALTLAQNGLNTPPVVGILLIGIQATLTIKAAKGIFSLRKKPAIAKN